MRTNTTGAPIFCKCGRRCFDERNRVSGTDVKPNNRCCDARSRSSGRKRSSFLETRPLRGVVRGLKKLFEGFRRLPTWLQLGISEGLAAILIHPKSRAKLLQTLKSAFSTACSEQGTHIRRTRFLGAPTLGCAVRSTKTYREIQAAVKKATAIVHARRICLLSAGPVLIEEIVRGCGTKVMYRGRKIPKATLGECCARAVSSLKCRPAYLNSLNFKDA
jgi:hypothetical protein